MPLLTFMTRHLHAIVGKDVDKPGAHTAVLVCDDTTDVWAYATRSRHPPASERNDLMASILDVPLPPEEHAHRLAAVAMTAWRHRHNKLTGAGGAVSSTARFGRSPQRITDTQHTQDSNSNEACKSSARLSAVRPSAWNASDNDDWWDSDPDDNDGPLLIECDEGRLLVYPMRLPRKAGRDECRRNQRLLRPPPSQHGSRRPSFAHSNGSLSGETGASKSILNQISTSVVPDDHGERACSTEEDTDRDSLRSDSVVRNDIPVSLLLVLNAQSTTWHTLLRQARTFAEMGGAHAPAQPLSRQVVS